MNARRWTVNILVGAVLAAVGFLLSSSAPSRAAPKPEVVSLTKEGGIAAKKSLLSSYTKTEPVFETAAAEAPADEEPTPGLANAPVHHPRDQDEWQGMLVNTAAQALCETSARCGLAMACHDGQCGPCAVDSECAAGEACVLDHCLPASQVECRSRRDCSGEEVLCVLTGYSSDPRGNGAMKAKCQAAQGGVAAEEAPLTTGDPAPPADVAPTQLADAVRAHARAALESK